MGLFGFGEQATIYLPGCYSLAFLSDKVQNYKNILKRLNIDFRFIEEQLCCAGCLIDLGYETPARKIARDNLSFFKEKKIKKIITNCPLCLNSFSNEYKSMLPDWEIETEFILKTIFEEIKQDNELIKYFSNEKVVYYDSCQLGRYSKIYDAPRELLKLMGYNLVEMNQTKEETPCCGSCGQLDITNPELAKKIALNFLRQIKKTTVRKIITADPRAYWHLKNIIDLEKIDIQLIEFSEILCDSLDIEKTDNEQTI